MHSIMSSYNHAPYLPFVWPSSHSFFLPPSQSQGAKCPPVSIHPFESEKRYSDSGPSGLPCNILLNIMTKEQHASGLSDAPMNSIADLVKSDDRFLDQLEVMHYLNFSDY